MAHYLIVRGDNPSLALRVEAKHIKAAIASIDLEDGESVTVYRIAAEPKTVTVRSETVTRIVVE